MKKTQFSNLIMSGYFQAYQMKFIDLGRIKNIGKV